ncbi:acyl-CoA carboxylase subunit beta [Schaalia canis]|uniref:Acyl-CoA carboxylase subunit beta n=1 Tax=Schaalia canis TaxID=100469 RepID=A0A3P1SD57_9ACTO|nr:acyl-CoA carboxylase subunit beta [Schaalia canis]RRC94830.1 acyl-CoA carboxylase subunit beta [Schaalia canis]
MTSAPPPADRSRSAHTQAIASVVAQAEERAAARQHPKGKMTARERMATFFDDGQWTEVGQFIGGDVRTGDMGSAVLTGYGPVQGRMVAVYAQDFSIRGGTLGRVEGDKIIALIDTAIRMRIPIVGIQDSGGARIQEGVVALAQYGRIFRKSCEASGLIPQISLILGPCAGGAVYQPALTDFIVMTRENSHMFVTGPDVVRATTGEDVSFEELGGAAVHNFQSGVAHHMADSEQEAIDYVRSLLDYLPSNCEQEAPRYEYTPLPEDEAAAQAVGDLVPCEPRVPYNVVEVIESLVDHGEFVEIQSFFAPRIVIGFACIDGRSVGIVANQPMEDAGTLDVDASEKGARFVRFCDAFGLPIITLVDVPGYRPGTEQEQAGIIRRGAKLIVAYANATVPMVTVILRKAYGGAFIVMGSKSIGADLAFSWPNAQIAVMGAEGAVSILHRRELAAAQEDGSFEQTRAALVADYERDCVSPDLSIKTGELDGIITPASTRSVLINSLRLLESKDQDTHSPKKHDNGPL